MRTALENWGVETWRGMVAAWHCDEMGHQSARFYASQAMEALRESLALLGLAPSGPAGRTVAVASHHIRFHRELRAGTPVHVRSAVVGRTDREIRIAQILVASMTGEIAAGFVARCPLDQFGPRLADMSPSMMCAIEADLAGDIPDACVPRGIGSAEPDVPVDLETADLRVMATGARGVIAVDECGLDGVFRTESFVARFSDATRLLMLQIQEAAGFRNATGGAALEARCEYLAHPRVGDRFVIRTGIVALGPKTRTVDYWMLDPASGRAWCAMRSLEAILDLESRRALSLSDDAQEKLRPLMIAAACRPGS